MAGLEKIVTDELVFEVADRLVGEGRKVSNRMVWDQIGGGSMTTIAAALRRWRERQQLESAPAPARTPIPESIAAALRDAVDRLWQAAQEETQKEIERLTQAMNARVAEAVAERDAALGELQATVEELRALEVKSADQESALLAGRQVAGALQDELAKAGERAMRAETRAVEIERRADDLGDELERVHAEAQAERERQAAALAQLGGQFKEVRAELADAHRLAQALEQQKAALERQVAESAAQQVTAEAARDSARQEAATTRENAARLQGQIEAMTAQHAALLQAMTGPKKAASPPSEPGKKAS